MSSRRRLWLFAFRALALLLVVASVGSAQQMRTADDGPHKAVYGGAMLLGFVGATLLWERSRQFS